MKLRSIIFWMHLASGLGAGGVIGILSFTGAALAFEKEIIAWAERDLRRIRPAAHADRMALDELIARFQESAGTRPSSVTIHRDPNATLVASLGRTNALYVNPYTGEVRKQGAEGARQFMQTMIRWHRWLGRPDQSRPTGKAVTGAANGVFLVLALTGVYLWWPRKWSCNAVRASSVLNLSLRGKARDWNWHNAVGLWSAPFLIVLTATALPISYRWANDLIYTVSRTQAPSAGAGLGGDGPAVEVPNVQAGTKPLSMAAFLEVSQQQLPAWQQITLRLADAGARAGREDGRKEGKDRQRRGPSPVTVTVKESGAWPWFAAAQLTLDPWTGAVLRRESFADYNLGRQIRSWSRFLHTGEALGPIGQAVAALASLGALVLVYTGIALAWRRFFPRQSTATPEPAADEPITSAMNR